MRQARARDCSTLRKAAPRALLHSQYTTVRYLPLGSPWVLPNVSYVHAPSGPWPVAGCMHELRSSVGEYPGWCRGWYREGGIPGYYPATRVLVLPGPNQSQIQGSAPTRALQGPGRPLRTPGLPALRYRPWTLIWARFRYIYLKVSDKPGVSLKKRDEACHTPYFKKTVQKSRP